MSSPEVWRVFHQIVYESTTSELLRWLRSSCQEENFKLVEKILIWRELELKLQLKREQEKRLLERLEIQDDLKRLNSEKSEMQEEIKRLKNEVHEVAKRYSECEEKITNLKKAIANMLGLDVSEIKLTCTSSENVSKRKMDRVEQVEEEHVHRDCHPGPLDESVLKWQAEHRSSLIWTGDIASTYHPLTVRRCDSAFQEAYLHAPRRVRDLIDVSGFGGVARACFLQVDHALVTALVERWRPETHTFHLPVGEATITLQDIAIIWGLRVDGDPIISNFHTLKKIEWQAKCEELLGFRPNDSDIFGNKIMKSAIEPLLLVPLHDDATYEEVAQRARRLLLILLGGHLFSDKSGKLLPLRYLLFLEDLERSGSMSWGSAVLAYMYRCLCTASLAEARDICGPMTLLQLWVWERIPILRPDVQVLVPLPELAPYGARWAMSRELHRLSSHVLVTCRDQLDALRHDQFVWLPYSEEVIQLLPPRYLDGSNVWRSSVPLICCDIIEFHLPERVMRQFGLEQFQPPDCETDRALHRMGHRGTDKKTWCHFHENHASGWDRRRECIVDGHLAANVHIPLPEYMDWYVKITRLLIGNPAFRSQDRQGYHALGSSSAIMARMMRRCHRMCDQAISQVRDVDQLVVMFAAVKHSIGRALNVAGDNIGCIPSSSPAIPSTYLVEGPLRRPKDKIESRGQPRHRRGGKRRLEDRNLGDIRNDPPNGALDVPFDPPQDSGRYTA